MEFGRVIFDGIGQGRKTGDGEILQRSHGKVQVSFVVRADVQLTCEVR